MSDHKPKPALDVKGKFYCTECNHVLIATSLCMVHTPTLRTGMRETGIVSSDGSPLVVPDGE
jgi:hypothetical protein